MKVIALCGQPQVGKTETLKKLIENFSNKINPEYISKTTTNRKDLNAIFLYNKKLLLITTYGDSPDLIMEKYKYLKNKAATLKNLEYAETVFICAAHFSGKSIDTLVNITNENNSSAFDCPIIVIKPNVPDTPDNLRNDVIKRKVAEIEGLI